MPGLKIVALSVAFVVVFGGTVVLLRSTSFSTDNSPQVSVPVPEQPDAVSATKTVDDSSTSEADSAPATKTLTPSESVPASSLPAPEPASPAAPASPPTPTPPPTPSLPTEEKSEPEKLALPAIALDQPINNTRVVSGGTLSLRWRLLSGDPDQRITFWLENEQSDSISDLHIATAGSLATEFPIELGAGTYNLTVTHVEAGDDIRVPITVEGARSQLDPLYSEILFDIEETVADGLCAIEVEAYAYDQFDQPMAGRVIAIESSRGDIDTILPHSPAINHDGEMYFSVTSSTVGEATFRAHIDGVYFEQETVVTFLDPSEEYCY